ncbi:MAG: MOSC domain-containing protein [Pseudomonadota bacterium]
MAVDRDASLRSSPESSIAFDFAGPVGEAHGGLTRPSCSRVLTQYPRGTEIKNTRQICIVSEEEMAAVAAQIGVDEFNPAWAGANVVIRGIPDFTHIPPSSRLQGAEGCTFTVDMENLPCMLPAPVIEEDAPGHGQAFKRAAKNRRGITAWVERPGSLRLGEAIALHIPAQRAWQGG